ncbi:MAG: GNAT family N-acetyltransferase, partial [Usitatibacter sp.]
ALFRITPFSNPADLDAELASRGYGRFDATAVEVARIYPEKLDAGKARVMELPMWVEAVGDLRGSSKQHRAAHLARLEGMPLTLRAIAIESAGRVVATGLTMVEDDCAGLFDIVTHEEERRRGHAKSIVAGLLLLAREQGARFAYLQVTERNEPARRLYRQFGFEQQYLYWYRGREGERG